MNKLVKTTALLSVLALTGGVQAEESTSPTELQQQAQALQQKIVSIQQNALQANPELEAQRAALEKMVLDAMREQGASPRQDGKRLDELQQQISQPGLTDEKRMQIAQEAQAIQNRLQQAQQKVMQDQNLLEAQEAFRENMMIAMNDENANTENLMEELQQVVQQLRMQQMQQQQ